MIDRVSSIVDSFNRSLLSKRVDSYNLFGGELGKIFLEIDDNSRLQFLASAVEEAYYFKQKYSNVTFCSGSAGINWAYSFLYKDGLLSRDTYRYLCADDTEIMDGAISLLRKGNYDFLHGAIGVAWYFLYKANSSRKYARFFFDFFQELERIMQNEDKVCYAYDFTAQQIVDKKINLSLSHGISSVLKFCLQCITQNICPNQASQIATNVLDVLFRSTNPETSYCYFPYSISVPMDDSQRTSRLAWCYGDLGTAMIMYQAGKVLARVDVIDRAMEILLHSSKRRIDEETQVVDAGFCHGASGIAHIFGKIYTYTNNPVFREAHLFWMQRIFDYAESEPSDGSAFKMFDAVKSEYRTDYSLLEGSVGVGLVLQSFRSKRSPWDYCLMLND